MKTSQSQYIIITPSKKIEQLKQRARKLKREKGMLHTEALDFVAKETGIFNHWKHATECASITAKTELSFKSGLLIAMDMKEADDIGIEDDNFIYDVQASCFTEPELKKDYESFIELDTEYNPEGKTNKELLSDIELEEDFSDFINNLVFYRYKHSPPPKTINDALILINEFSFWPPMFAWLRGKFYDTGNLPSLDKNGEVIGVRL